MFEIHNLVKGWGYEAGSYRDLTRIVEIYSKKIQLGNYDDAYDFATYTYVSKHDGQINLLLLLY